MSYCIAVDGPAGAGKSTIAKQVAKKMQLVYVDTGAMYRAMALFMIRENVAGDDTDTIDAKCVEADITLKYENGEQVVCLNGENVNAYLRTEEVGKMASSVATRKKVRERVVSRQKELAKTTDVIMDGRDIGTCVLPDAICKIYLTASVETRALRRLNELQEKGMAADLEVIKKDIADRDYRDMNRDVSPLKQADDAVLVDSSDMGIEEVTEKIISIFKEKAGK